MSKSFDAGLALIEHTNEAIDHLESVMHMAPQERRVPSPTRATGCDEEYLLNGAAPSTREGNQPAESPSAAKGQTGRQACRASGDSVTDNNAASISNADPQDGRDQSDQPFSPGESDWDDDGSAP